jgi:glycolate oxidase iron-sulfur subunit
MLERSVDRCVRCGFCLTACPTYRLFDDEESGPRGRIALVRAVAAGEVTPSVETLATFSECLGCRACESACPSGVIYDEAFLYGREALAAVSPPLPFYVRFLLRSIEHPFVLSLLRALWRLGGHAVVPLVRRVRALPHPLSLLVALPRPSRSRIASHPGAAVALHRGCVMDILWEGTNDRAVALLRETGLGAQPLSLSAGCCGALHAHQGDRRTARRLAQRVIAAFEASGAQRVINLAGGCSAFIKEYSELFEHDDPWRERAERMAAGVTDVATLLVERGRAPHITDTSVTYQDSCHLRHGLKVWREPRALLTASAAFCEMPSADQCCGSAGIYNLLRPDVASRILAAKVREVAEMGVDEVIVSNPGCELQWRMGLHAAGSPIRVRHIVDFLTGG